MTPQIDNLVEFDETTEQVVIPSKTYKLNIENSLTEDENIYTDRIAGFVDDIEAIKQATYHILSIERYAYDIYDDDYGVELEQYIGQDFEYISATIQETLEEALTQDDRIVGVNITDIQKISEESILVRFTLLTKGDEIEMEVIVNV